MVDKDHKENIQAFKEILRRMKCEEMRETLPAVKRKFILKLLLKTVLGQLPMRTINSPPDKNKAQPLPTRTTIPRTIPHQDNSPLGLGPLPRNKTTLQDQNLYGGELSSWGVVRIRSRRDGDKWDSAGIALLLKIEFFDRRGVFSKGMHSQAPWSRGCWGCFWWTQQNALKLYRKGSNFDVRILAAPMLVGEDL